MIYCQATGTGMGMGMGIGMGIRIGIWKGNMDGDGKWECKGNSSPRR